MKNLITILFLSLSISAYSQALFSKRMKSVTDSGFCIDCGDIKVEKDSAQFAKLLTFITSHNYINKTKGTVKFQVLIDSVGSGRVLSHTDTTNSVLVQNIVHSLNAFKGWKPASTNSKLEPLVSVVVAMEISNDKITGDIQRAQESNDQLLTEKNSGTFNNIAAPALTKHKSRLNRVLSISFGSYGSNDLVSSVMSAIGFSLYERSGQLQPKNSLIPLKGQPYDPFNYNRNLPSINFERNQTNQFWLAPLTIIIKSTEQ